MKYLELLFLIYGFITMILTVFGVLDPSRVLQSVGLFFVFAHYSERVMERSKNKIN